MNSSADIASATALYDVELVTFELAWIVNTALKKLRRNGEQGDERVWTSPMGQWCRGLEGKYRWWIDDEKSGRTTNGGRRRLFQMFCSERCVKVDIRRRSLQILLTTTK